MTAVLLPWNTDTTAWDGTFAGDIEVVRRTGVLRKSWRVLAPPPLVHSADVWLLAVRRDGSSAGLIGHGVLAYSHPCDHAGASAVQLLIDVDALLPHGDEVPAGAELANHGLVGDSAQSGRVTALSAPAAFALRTLWNRSTQPTPGTPAPSPGTLPSHAVRRCTENRFEADTDLRRTVLAHRGSVCHACGLDGEQTYGAAGADLVQVHLITPPTLIGEDFEPDALVDLVPLCPTCHVVVHSAAPDAYNVSDVRAMVRNGGYLRGSVPSEHQLDAQQAAARILEAGR